MCSNPGIELRLIHLFRARLSDFWTVELEDAKWQKRRLSVHASNLKAMIGDLQMDREHNHPRHDHGHRHMVVLSLITVTVDICTHITKIH